MKYFSLRDSKRIKPFDFEPESVELPLYLSFYAWWNDLPIPKLSALSTGAAKAESTEALYQLFHKVKEEYPLLTKPQSFLPDWSIFSSLNAWLSNILSEQFSSIRNKIDLIVPQKLDALEYQHLNACIGNHAVEVQNQPKIKRSKEAYKLASEPAKILQKTLQRNRDHREFVVDTQAPKGEPNITFFGSHAHVFYGPPTRDAVSEFDKYLNRIDAEFHAEEKNHKKLSKNLRNQFFEFIQPEENRTDRAIQLIKTNQYR